MNEVQSTIKSGIEAKLRKIENNIGEILGVEMLAYYNKTLLKDGTDLSTREKMLNLSDALKDIEEVKKKIGKI